MKCLTSLLLLVPCTFALGCGGSEAPAAATPSSAQSAPSTGGETAPARPVLITLLESGSWGWLEGDFSCEENAVTYRFAEDLGSVVATRANPVPNVTTGVPETEYSYDIDEIGDSRIRMRLRGEDRMTDAGTPVVWDLVVLSRDSFCWHRTDWPEGACTGALERCD